MVKKIKKISIRNIWRLKWLYLYWLSEWVNHLSILASVYDNNENLFVLQYRIDNSK